MGLRVGNPVRHLEDVPRGVRIPVVLDVAVGAFPFAHVQRFAAGADAARVADLAGGFIPCDSHGLTVHASCVRFDQAYEGSPAGVEHALAQPRLRQSCGV